MPETKKRNQVYVVHHTAMTGDEQPVTLVHQWHLNRKTKDGKPWAGIGYHYYIVKTVRFIRDAQGIKKVPMFLLTRHIDIIPSP